MILWDGKAFTNTLYFNNRKLDCMEMRNATVVQRKVTDEICTFPENLTWVMLFIGR